MRNKRSNNDDHASDGRFGIHIIVRKGWQRQNQSERSISLSLSLFVLVENACRVTDCIRQRNANVFRVEEKCCQIYLPMSYKRPFASDRKVNKLLGLTPTCHKIHSKILVQELLLTFTYWFCFHVRLYLYPSYNDSNTRHLLACSAI